MADLLRPMDVVSAEAPMLLSLLLAVALLRAGRLFAWLKGNR